MSILTEVAGAAAAWSAYSAGRRGGVQLGDHLRTTPAVTAASTVGVGGADDVLPGEDIVPALQQLPGDAPVVGVDVGDPLQRIAVDLAAHSPHSDAAAVHCQYTSIDPANASSPELPADLFTVPVDVVEAALLLVPSPPLPVAHYFAAGTYAREMRIPAGALLTAREYLIPHVCILSEGSITVWGDGVEPLVFTAPHTFVAPAGTRRIGYAHCDVTWTTLLPNPQDLRDPDSILDACTRIPVVHMLPGDAGWSPVAIPEVLQNLLGLPADRPPHCADSPCSATLTTGETRRQDERWPGGGALDGDAPAQGPQHTHTATSHTDTHTP